MDTTECCPQFDPAVLDNKTHDWYEKLFLVNDVVQFMHIPLNMGHVVTKMFKKIQNANASPDTKDFLMLCYDPSPWKSQIHMTITKAIPGENVVKLTGTFVSKVFDGPYNAVPKWITEMDAMLATKGQKALKYYFHYAYCPKCSKKYGHNYCVAFAQIA